MTKEFYFGFVNFHRINLLNLKFITSAPVAFATVVVYVLCAYGVHGMFIHGCCRHIVVVVVVYFSFSIFLLYFIFFLFCFVIIVLRTLALWLLTFFIFFLCSEDFCLLYICWNFCFIESEMLLRWSTPPQSTDTSTSAMWSTTVATWRARCARTDKCSPVV